MRIIVDSATEYAEEFASWLEFVETVKERSDKCSDARKSQIKNVHGSHQAFWLNNDEHWHDFSQTRDLGEAINLAIDGWPEGLDKAGKLVAPLFEKVSHLIERVEPVYDIEGGALDIGRYHDNDPEMFCRFDNVIAEAAGNRVIRILANGSPSSGISTETIMAKGATIASLIELLELAGNRVELTVCPFAGDQKGVGFKIWNKIIVKQADQPLDLGRVTYALAHPSTARRLGFTWMDTIPSDAHVAKFNRHYGYPMEIDSTGYDIYIQKSHLDEIQWANPESATAWILQSLKEQGVSLKEES